MTALSRLLDSGPFVLLAHVFVTDRTPDTLKFEMLEVNGAGLRNHIGLKHQLSCDGGAPFWGELISLELCESTSPGLAFMRDRPTLKGLVRIYAGEPEHLQ